VRVWDTQTGQQSQVLSEGSSPVNIVSFSPKERIVACGSDDGVIRLWDIDSGVLKMRLALRSKRSVLALSFSPDGQMLASGGSATNDEKVIGGEINVWDTHRWDFINALMGHNDVVTSLAFLSDNRTLASGSRDGTIRIWDVPTGKLNNTISGHQGGVSSVAFSPDGSTLVSGGKDDSIRLWDVQSGKTKQNLAGNGGEVFAVTFSPDGKIIASGSQDRTIKLWY
jgi:WD40 repeat protein